ncbi:MAG: hypothetical protein JWM76_3595, partial [Pseudonocardiales bacterium]|nr:hypothetical protein [Pseudonocardiales bacterium]
MSQPITKTNVPATTSSDASPATKDKLATDDGK